MTAETIADGIGLFFLRVFIGWLVIIVVCFAIWVVYCGIADAVRKSGKKHVFITLLVFFGALALGGVGVIGLLSNPTWFKWFAYALWSLIALGFAGCYVDKLRTPEGRAELRYIWTGTKAIR
jgi:hypothetical protein